MGQPLQKFINISPLARYTFGKSIQYNFGVQLSRHEIYAGMSTHLNFGQNLPSINGDFFVQNGLAARVTDFFHPNVGYRYKWNKSKYFTPHINIDILLGGLGIVNKFYNPAYMDSLGNKYYTTYANSTPPSIRILFMQLTAGIGCDIKITPKLIIVNKIGVGETFLWSKQYLYGNLFVKEFWPLHFVHNYQVGCKILL